MNIEQIGADSWQQWVADNDAVLIDVREPYEWQQTGVLPDARLISMGELPVSLDQLTPDTPILVVCRTGNRSQHAAAWLQSHGYRAANLAGGIVAVARAMQNPR